MLHVAHYAYHNGEPAAAMRYLDQAPYSAEAAVLRIKCLCELDQAGLARDCAEAALQDFPTAGALRYYLGMTLYLSGGAPPAIEQAFREAREAGHEGGSLGMAFVAYAAGDAAEAMAELTRAAGREPELEHVRLLMMFQVALDQGDFPRSEHFLDEADAVLRQVPSLLRSYWGQLCWVRLLNASRAFDLATAALRRLMAQLSAERTPRLARNAADLELRIASRDGASEVRLPTGALVRRIFPPDEILRRPTLSCLFFLLEGRGEAGATKVEIVRHVWGDAYNPLRHDDRLYKAIGRLRRLLDGGERVRTLFLRGQYYVLADGAPSAGQPNSQESAL